MQKNLPSVFFFLNHYYYYYYLNQNTFETSLAAQASTLDSSLGPEKTMALRTRRCEGHLSRLHPGEVC